MSKFVKQFYLASMVVFICFGITAERFGIFPAPQFKWVVKQAKLALDLLFPQDQWYYVARNGRARIETHQPEHVQPGLTMFTGIGPELILQISVVDALGERVQHWDIDWFKLWPDAKHLPDNMIPQSRPGTHIHGAKLMENGDVVFNFENLGLVRLDACGNTVFRLPYQTHHSIHEDESGIIWLPGQTTYYQKWDEYPGFEPPFKDDTIARVSQRGELLETVSVMKLLDQNNLMGLTLMSSLDSRDPRPTGDLFHLNDVEVFPSTIAEGVFKHGDVMISLRNINTVLVYDPKTLAIRFISTGRFVRQHDPDFIDGNRISVYDNNNLPGAKDKHSKIVEVSAIDGSVRPLFTGSKAQPFYSTIMGKHQWLSNGNLLVLESMNGRAMELRPDNTLVWSYNNIIEGTNKVGIMAGADRLAPHFDKDFFAAQRSRCEASN